MVYGDFKDKPKRATSNTVSCDKLYNSQNSQDDGYQSQLLFRVYKYFDGKYMQMVK